MPGFYLTNAARRAEPENFGSAPCVAENMTCDGFYICRNTRDQFMDDKLFFTDEELAVVLEGVILNRAELSEGCGGGSWRETVKKLYYADRDGFFSAFRGMFSGAVYDRTARRLTVFADQIGNRAVFYYHNGETLIIGSQLNYVTDTMRACGIPLAPNHNGLRQFLCWGCFPDDSTGVSGVLRLLPGDCLVAENGAVRVRTYHEFTENTAPDISDADAIELLDSSFRRAVLRGLRKNEEYGYTGVIDISGGADSRMIAYTARSLGSKNEIMCHYSQSGSYEEEIAKKIASELGFEFYSSTLDDAKFLLDIDRIIAMNSGTGYYCGITGGKRMLEALGGRRLGIEFTGLLGDVFEGAMISEHGDGSPMPYYPRYRFTDVIPPEQVSVGSVGRFRTNNLYWLFVRGMMCGMSTFFTRQNYVEPYTPFGDVDFLEACLSIPWERKVRDRIQLYWLAEKYPAAMKHKYAAMNAKLSVALHPCRAYIANKLAALGNIAAAMCGRAPRCNMNPFDLWEREKPWLRSWLDSYYTGGMAELRESGKFDGELLGQMEKIRGGGSVMARYTVLSAIEYCKRYII